MVVAVICSYLQLSLLTFILAIVFVSLAVIIKIVRLIYKKKMKYGIIAFFSFYFGFVLTAFQIVFTTQGLIGVYQDYSGNQYDGNT